jgi:hypothetical protein
MATSLKDSYADRAQYPENLLWKPSSNFVLNTLGKKFRNLDEGDYPVICHARARSCLFIVDIDRPAGQTENVNSVKRRTNCDDLESWMGIESQAIHNPGSQTSSNASSNTSDDKNFVKADPQCRIM